MDTSLLDSPKIGISSCLLGANVRYDSGHKKNSFVTGMLKKHFEFSSFCPEVEIGLGIPREPIRLVQAGNTIRCQGTKSENLDVTDALDDVSHEQRHWHKELSGYILKKDSPSCGMERVKVYNDGMPTKKGIGIYAKRLMENNPNLPIEEEGRLEDAHLRENFIQRVYIYNRWKLMFKQSITLSALQEFHAKHKYTLMSHDQQKTRELGTLLADKPVTDIKSLTDSYVDKMTNILKIIPSKNNHANTLHHIQGYLKKSLNSGDKTELSEVVDDYKKGLLPLIVPITLLRHHFRRYPNDYISQSYYLSPHPGELMLLNTI